MADGSIIGLELHLNGKEQVKKDLQEIFKYAEENKNIKLDIDSNVLNSITKLSETVTNLSKQIEELNKHKINIKTSNNVNSDINKQTESINNQKKAIEELNNAKSKKFTEVYNINDDSTKNVLKTIHEIKTAYGEIHKIQTDMQTGSVTYTDSANYEKQSESINKLNKSITDTIGKLNLLKETGLFNNSVFNNGSKNGLIDKLNSFGKIDSTNFEKVKNGLSGITEKIKLMEKNANKLLDLEQLSKKFNEALNLNPEYKNQYQDLVNAIEKTKSSLKKNSGTNTDISYKQLKADINDVIKLMNEEHNISVKIADDREKLVQAMAKGRENSEINSRNNQLKQEEAQSKAINKALEDNYKAKLKEEQELDKLNSKLNTYKETVKQIQSTGLFNKGVFDGNSKMKGFTDKLSSIDFSNLETAKKQMDSLGKSINTLESNGKRINLLQKNINSLRSGFNSLRTGENRDIFTTLDTTKIEEYKKAFESVTNIMKRAKANSGTVNDLEITKALDEAQQKFKALEKDFTNNLSIDKFISKINTSFNNLDKTNLSSDFVDKLQNKINSLNTSTARSELEKLYNELNKTNNLGGIKNNSSQIEKIQKQIENIKINLNSLRGKYGIKLVDEKSAIELDSVNKELNNLKSLKDRLGNGEIINGTVITSACNKSANAMKNLTNATKYNSSAMKMAQQDAISLGDALNKALGKFGIYTSVAVVMRSLFSEIKNGVKDVIALEDSMISLQRVYDITGDSVEKFQNKLVENSRQLATSATDYIDSVTSFKKLGYTIGEAQTLATQTTKFNLAGDINNMEEASTDVISILKGFKLEATDVVRVTDEINEASNTYAVTSQDLANSLQKSSSALSVYGNSLEQSMSMATVATEVLQDSDKVGRSLDK